jgi:hypothetical protein
VNVMTLPLVRDANALRRRRFNLFPWHQNPPKLSVFPDELMIERG